MTSSLHQLIPVDQTTRMFRFVLLIATIHLVVIPCSVVSSTKIEPPPLFLFDSESFPVQEYKEDTNSRLPVGQTETNSDKRWNRTTTTTTTTVDLWTLLSNRSLANHHRTSDQSEDARVVVVHHMVQWYQPSWSACQATRSSYIQLAQTLHTLTQSPPPPPPQQQQHENREYETLNDSSAVISVIQAHAISCAVHLTLCNDITVFPTVRIYSQPSKEEVGNVVVWDVHPRQLHPYTILDQLRIPYQRGSIVAAHGETANNDTNRTVMDTVLDAVAARKTLFLDYLDKRVDLEQDVHLVFELLLRHNAFADRNVVATSSNSSSSNNRVADPPLQPDAARALTAWLELVVRTSAPATQWHATAYELHTNAIYVVRHADYLHAILDEYMTDTSGGFSIQCRVTIDFGSSHLCGLWNMLWLMVQGWHDYNVNAIVVVPLSHHAEADMNTTRASNDTNVTANTMTMPSSGSSLSFNAIPMANFVSILLDYARHVGLSLTDDELDLFVRTAPSVETTTTTHRKGDTNDIAEEDEGKEDQSMALALWIGTARHHIQLVRLQRNKALLRQPVTKADTRLAEWPPQAACPACWDTNATVDTVRNRTSSSESLRPFHWNDAVVYQYIQLETFSGFTSKELYRWHQQVHPERYVKSAGSSDLSDEL